MGRREFIVVDPGGNWIRIGQTDNLPIADDSAPAQAASKLARATHAATLLADSKGDYLAAANRYEVRDVTTGSRTVHSGADLQRDLPLALAAGREVRLVVAPAGR